MQALTLWSNLVTQGSASKQCLSWSQTPAASTQFIDGKAAMMVNGPWNFPTMNGAHLFYGKQFGVVPVPVQKSGQKAIVPLGGEDWMVSKTGGSQAQQLSFDYIKGLQTPEEELQLAKLFGYLPGKMAVAQRRSSSRPGPSGLSTCTRPCSRIRARSIWARSTRRSRRRCGRRSSRPYPDRRACLTR